MLYVYGQPYQTGGQLFTRVFDQAMTGTFIFQLVMIFILGELTANALLIA